MQRLVHPEDQFDELVVVCRAVHPDRAGDSRGGSEDEDSPGAERLGLVDAERPELGQYLRHGEPEAKWMGGRGSHDGPTRILSDEALQGALLLRGKKPVLVQGAEPGRQVGERADDGSRALCKGQIPTALILAVQGCQFRKRQEHGGG